MVFGGEGVSAEGQTFSRQQRRRRDPRAGRAIPSGSAVCHGDSAEGCCSPRGIEAVGGAGVLVIKGCHGVMGGDGEVDGVWDWPVRTGIVVAAASPPPRELNWRHSSEVKKKREMTPAPNVSASPVRTTEKERKQKNHRPSSGRAAGSPRSASCALHRGQRLSRLHGTLVVNGPGRGPNNRQTYRDRSFAIVKSRGRREPPGCSRPRARTRASASRDRARAHRPLGRSASDRRAAADRADDNQWDPGRDREGATSRRARAWTCGAQRRPRLPADSQ